MKRGMGKGINVPILLGNLGSVVRSPSGVRNEAPAKNEFGAFLASKHLRSGSGGTMTAPLKS